MATQEAETSKSGKWFDLKSEKVVDSPPEEGVLIVAPGGELTAAVKDAIDRYENFETATDPQTVETATTSKKK